MRIKEQETRLTLHEHDDDDDDDDDRRPRLELRTSQVRSRKAGHIMAKFIIVHVFDDS